MSDIVFKTIHNVQFERMRLDVIVIGMTFNELMVKLKHADSSWREPVQPPR